MNVEKMFFYDGGSCIILKKNGKLWEAYVDSVEPQNRFYGSSSREECEAVIDDKRKEEAELKSLHGISNR